MNVTPLEIELALASVNEPETNKDINSLGWVQDIQIHGSRVKIIVALPSANYVFATKLKQDCSEAILKNVSEELEVEITFTIQKKTKEDSPAKNIKHIIVVASGKGGVGKSTIAAQLALALAKSNYKTALFDADVYGPSLPTLFNINREELQGREENGKTILIPVEKYGIKLMSVGFLVPEDTALIWRGPMASNTLKQLFTETDWGELDYLIVDFPPGTGDIQLTLSHLLPIDGVIMVSTPQQLAIADVKRAFNMFQEEKPPIPVLGLIENMAYFVSEQDPSQTKQYIFGQNGGKQLAETLNVPLLAEIPIVPNISNIKNLNNLNTGLSVTEIFSTLAQLLARKFV